MMLPLNTLSLILLIFVTATHLTTGVQIYSVGLKNGLPYAKGGVPSHIKFNLTMEPDEILQSVVWQKDDGKSRYEWQASGSVNVSGIFLGSTNTSAENGELLFFKAHLDHRGDYNLTVNTSNGTASAIYKLIIFQYSSFSVSYPTSPLINCTWAVKMEVYQVAPYPNISCLFEDGIEGPLSVPLDAIAEVKPNVTDHRNGTFHYKLAVKIPFQEIPMESWMSWQFWIEESSISLYKFKSSITAEPCPEPPTVENLTYNFTTWEYKSCYGGYSQYAKVNYSCTDNPNLEPQKTLECRSEGRWIETDTTPWPTCKTPQPDTTPQSESSRHSSGTPLTFHRILLTATFLIASYYVVK